MKQEGRHIDFYLDQARKHLDTAAAQRQTRFMLRRLWAPVGFSVMPEDESLHLSTTLFANADGRAMIERIDRRIDSLPGLDGMGLMAGAMDRYVVV
jgi:hypothetical protein